MTEPAQKRSEWAEYRVVCADSEERHYVSYKTSRPSAIDALTSADKKGCGPHLMQQRLVVRYDYAWGDVLTSDPQTDAVKTMWAEAKKRECPKCHADKGKVCRNMNNQKPAKWPHAERLPPTTKET